MANFPGGKPYLSTLKRKLSFCGYILHKTRRCRIQLPVFLLLLLFLKYKRDAKCGICTLYIFNFPPVQSFWAIARWNCPISWTSITVSRTKCGLTLATWESFWLNFDIFWQLFANFKASQPIRTWESPRAEMSNYKSIHSLGNLQVAQQENENGVSGESWIRRETLRNFSPRKRIIRWSCK